MSLNVVDGQLPAVMQLIERAVGHERHETWEHHGRGGKRGGGLRGGGSQLTVAEWRSGNVIRYRNGVSLKNAVKPSENIRLGLALCSLCSHVLPSGSRLARISVVGLWWWYSPGRGAHKSRDLLLYLITPEVMRCAVSSRSLSTSQAMTTPGAIRCDSDAARVTPSF